MPSDENQLKELIKQGRKIDAIKVLRDADNLSLKDAKEKVEQLQTLLIEAGEIDPKLAKSGCAGLILFACALPLLALVF